MIANIRMKNRWLISSALLLSVASSAQTAVDSTQAVAMQKLLERCHAGEVLSAAIDELIRLQGTQLIIAQQNISRRITADQYRDVLISACKGEAADIKPSDPGARALKGAEGLMRD